MKRASWVLASHWFLALLVWSMPASAQDDEVAPFLQADTGGGWETPEEDRPPEPARIIATLGGGSALRIVRNLDLSQELFAPAYIDLFGAYVLPTSSFLRHGVGVGASLNLSGDGSFSEGLDGLEQIVLSPAYVGHMRPSVDLAATVKFSLPIAVTPSFSPGLELSGALAFLLTAGVGVYGELGVAAYLGQDTGDGSTLHPVASGELGVLLDYEVLP